ncbi:hypothetical protein MMC13_002038 [Lambiella insularis]|nr:hypothetical protein [Lambiella insularis]
MAQRRGLQQHGQLVRKEFMLEDRNNWPTINPPPGLLPQYAQQMTGYPGNVISHLNRTQQQAYMQNPLTSGAYQGMGPSPAKRQRQAPPAQRPGSSASLSAGAMAHDPAVEGEEDYALGDYMDLITPREISTERYKQHHDWMAEIISSPYATSQIMPVDLGIGRRGELESLTRGFFKAPVGPTPRDLDKASVAAQILESGRAEEFAKRATDRIAQINAEMGKMKRVHAKRMAKIGKSTVVKEAEKRLRSAVIKLEDSGMQPSMTTHFDTTAAIIRQQERVDEIAQEVETAEDLKIEQILTVKCVQKGGLEEKDPLEPKLVNEAATATSTTIDDSLNGPLPPVDLVTFSDFDDKTDWLQGDQGPDSETVDLGDAPLKSESHNDMQGPSSSLEAHNQIGDSGDWVIVNKQGGEDVDTTALDEAHRLTNPDATNVRQTELDSLAGDLPEFSTDVHGLSNEGFDSTEFDDTVDFGNLDTAGDALAAYGEPDGTVGNDDQLGLLEDSAFGDAFHHTDPTAGGEEGHP